MTGCNGVVSQSSAFDEDFERLLDALYSSLAEIPALESFLCTARTIFAYDHAALIMGSWEAKNADPVFFIDKAEALEFAEALYRSESMDSLPYGAAVECKMTLFCSGREMVLDVLALRLEDEQGRPVHLLLWRNETHGGFYSEARSLLNRLISPLQRSIKLFHRIAHLSRRQIVSDAAIATADIGVILASIEGEALLTNAIADELLDRKDGLQLIHGRLRALTPADTATLLTHVRCKAAEQQAEPDLQIYAPLALPRANHPLPLTVIVRPGPPFWPLKNPLQRTAMLVLRDPGRRPIIPGATLARLFGLTPAEALLASELARGASLDEASDHLGISRNTARTQLQSVYMKTGVNRQGELVRMLLSSAAALSR